MESNSPLIVPHIYSNNFLQMSQDISKVEMDIS